ncbi:MAG: hypothetical protein DRJ42_28125 [Deltaproteobacteria bacterium]|nr:MAG: hypothetical protein DRJ42_28125 [Deltaproteobacteria bacterium]
MSHFKFGPSVILGEARDRLTTIDGLLYYRISGDGCRRGLFGDGEPYLKGADLAKAKRYKEALTDVRKALGRFAEVTRELGDGLDEIMGYES